MKKECVVQMTSRSAKKKSRQGPEEKQRRMEDVESGRENQCRALERRSSVQQGRTLRRKRFGQGPKKRRFGQGPEKQEEREEMG